MKSVYHEGELAVQRRAGVVEMARRVGNGIHDSIPETAQEFLQEQPMAVLSSVGQDGRVWCSVLTGEPGFLRTLDEHTLWIDATPHPADPLAENLRNRSENPFAQATLGMLAIEFETRRRMRLNGVAEVMPDGEIVLHAQEVYANCPKYIQAREISNTATEGQQEGTEAVQHGTALSAQQQAWIGSADTFFIASAAPGGRADASHRGGKPGFVRLLDARTLEFPDYSGNMMFNTLGNITANPNAGLLFLNFETGDTLQLTGGAQVIWEPERAARFAGAERVVEFHIERTVQTPHANPLRFRFMDYSRFNPS